ATYVACAETIRGEALAAAVFAALVSWAQRVLSTPVRLQRRQEGALTELGKQFELGLRLLSAAMVALAVALVLLRVTCRRGSRRRRADRLRGDRSRHGRLAARGRFRSREPARAARAGRRD